MKIEFDPQDIEAMAQKVAEHLKDMLAHEGKRDGDSELLTVDGAATFLKTTKGQIYQWTDNARHGLGDFPYLKAGRLLRFSKRALLSWLSNRNYS